MISVIIKMLEEKSYHNLKYTWMSVEPVKAVHAAQWSWSNGSSIETIGYSLINSLYKSVKASVETIKLLSLVSDLFLKSKSYFPSLEYKLQ